MMDTTMKMMKTAYGVRLLALWPALVLAPLLHAAELYVATDGNDENAGTAERPFASLGKGAASARPGDTVWIKPGTYPVADVIWLKSGAAGAPIAYRAQARGEAVFDGQGRVPGRAADGVITMGKKDWIILDGVRVINSRWAGIAARGCANITVQNCSTKNTLASGIYIRASTGVKVLSNSVQRACVHPTSKPVKDTQECISLVGCTDFEIAYNEVFDRLEDTNNGGEGIDTKEGCRNGKVHHNHVHDLVRLGIYCDAFGSQLENIEIFANTVHNCRAGIAVACEAGGTARGISIHDNLVRDCARVGLRLAGYLKGGPIQDVAIYQNTVVRCGSWGGAWETSGLLVEAQNASNRNFVVRNNIFSGNRDQISTKKQTCLTLDRNLLHGPSQVTGENALVADPLFVNAASNDFRLMSGSPAIDAALGEPLSTRDHDDQARPLPGNTKALGDLGAFEWNSASGAKAVQPRAAALPAAPVGAVAKPAAASAITFPLLGNIQTRSAKEIVSSRWSVGGETLDRDFAIYANYKKYLGPLGAKQIRLQAGWAKCEKKLGVYDFGWLDEIVNDALAQGVQPWIETSYGNPIYPGGGGTGLGAGLPKSPEALAAWDKWVKAIVARYKDRVHEWEVWNEPDGGHGITADGFAEFHLRTAAIIRAEQPQARIFALALASPGKTGFVEVLLKLATERGQLGLIDAITIHGYPANPDHTGIDLVRRVVARYSPTIEVRQGETGAPSGETVGALRELSWTELKQAKWDLRRMLANHGKDVPFNLFTLCELKYTQPGMTGFNRKGLLRCNDDKTVAGPKLAYFAAQRVFSIFDDTLERIRDFKFTTPCKEKLAVSGYRQKVGGSVMVTAWLSGAPPEDSNQMTPVDLTFHASRFTSPVYADLLTGKVYALPRDRWSVAGDAITFNQLPIYDSPILIAEKSALSLGKPEGKHETH